MRTRSRWTVGATLLACAGLACSEDLTVAWDCGDIDFPLGLDVDLPLPPHDFEVHCVEGWVSDAPGEAETQTYSLPAVWPWVVGRFDEGWLIAGRPSGPSDTARWSEWLGTQVDDYLVVMVSPDFSTPIWHLTDLATGLGPIRGRAIVSPDSGPELWLLGRDEGDHPESLMRVGVGTGAVEETIPWPGETDVDATLSASGSGAWVVTSPLEHMHPAQLGLARAPSFGAYELVEPLSEANLAADRWGVIAPTPAGGALWVLADQLRWYESDGSLRWSVPLSDLRIAAVGDEGPVTAAAVSYDAEVGVRVLWVYGLDRDDGSRLWSRRYHRFEFSGNPPAEAELYADIRGLRSRAGGGAFLAVADAYPSQDCLTQPLLLAVDRNGEVDWAHRVDTCGYGYLYYHDAVDDGAVFLMGNSRDVAAELGVAEYGEAWPLSWVRRFDP